MSIKIQPFEYPPKAVSWFKRDVLLFANSVGCQAKYELHFLYEFHPYFQVFPTYPIVLTFKYDDQDTVDFLARNASTPIPPNCPLLDWQNAVDGRRRMSFVRQLPPSSEGRSFEIRSKVLDVFDKGPGKGTVMERQHVLVDKDTGDVYTRSWETAFFIGTGGWGGERGSKTKRYPPPEPAREPDAVSVFQTTAETAHLYRLNGDYNPLHATPEPGTKLGYGGIILHGLFSWNVAAHAILARYGANDGKNLRDFEARFAAPVRPGDRLHIPMWAMRTLCVDEVEPKQAGEELAEIRFQVKVGAKLVLSDGRALLSLKQHKEARL